MPKDYRSFCLVTEHLSRNAHRYWKNEADAKGIEDDLQQGNLKVEVKEEPCNDHLDLKEEVLNHVTPKEDLSGHKMSTM